MPLVDGFSIDTTAACYYSTNPAAMPVAWLYMLKDGTLTVPSSGANNTATFTSNAPTSNNPIVGRIAFWTDDETCKLNINTASEGMPWNPPTFTSPEDTGFNNYAPGANEYNRFLGHPSSVSLSPVLWSYFGFQHPAQLAWSTPPYWSNVLNTNYIFVWSDLPPVPSPLITNVNSPTNYLATLFGKSGVANGILPRTASVTNGSCFGSFRTVDTNSRTNFSGLTPRTDRLYASVDEMNFLVTNGLLAPRTNNSQVFSPQTIAKLGFFLTTQSRAPEVNILNLPRICLWPLNDTNAANTNTVNAYAPTAGTNRWSFLDRMIAQCSTLGTNPYYFTRYDPLDPFNDANIPRNKILYGYLAKLLQTPLPGFASTNGTPSSFATRWGTNGCYETATLCFDYIRSCVNLIDSYGSNTTASDATNPAIRYAYSYSAPPTNFSTNGRDNADASASIPGKVLPPGCGQVVPITITTNGVTTRGMGRFPVIKGVNLVFCAVAADQPPLMISNTGATPRAPIVPWQINPLHPYPMYTALTNFNSNSGWDYPTDFTRSSLETNDITGSLTTIIRTNLFSMTMSNQYPSAYPATNTAFNVSAAAMSLITFTRGTNAWSAITGGVGWSNNWATNIPVVYYTNSAVTTNTGTNSYQFLTTGGIPGMTNAHALTITHAGLVYGGDIDSNNPVRTNYGFDAYNIYFSNIASALGIASTVPNVPYINQIFVSNRTVPPFATNYVTNMATISSLTIPNTNPANKLFPNPYETVMQPVLLINHALTTPGFPPYTPNFKIRVRGLGNLTADGSNCFASGDYGQLYTNTVKGAGNIGQASGDAAPDLFGISISGNGMSNMIAGATNVNRWPFVGNFLKATNTASPNFGRTFTFGGGTITIDYLKPSADYTTTSSNEILQSVTISFPSTKFPTPKLPPFNGTQSQGYNSPPWYIGFGTNCVGDASTAPGSALNFIAPMYLLASNTLPPNTNASYGLSFGTYFPGGWFFMNEQWGVGTGNANGYGTATTIRSIEAGYGDWRLPAMMRTISSSASGVTAPSAGNYGYTLTTMTNLYIPHLLYFASNAETSSGLAASSLTNNTNFFWRAAHSVRGMSQFLTDPHSGHIFSATPGAFLQSFVNASTNGNDPGLFCGISIATPNPNNTGGKLLAHIGPYPPSFTIPTGPRNIFPDAMSTVDFVGYVTNATSANLFANVWTNGGDFDNPAGGGR